MATGYTSIIGTDENLTFSKFTLRCARAFGACIHQRDDNGSDLPKLDEVSNYHKDELIKAKKELVRFKKLSDVNAKKEFLKIKNDEIVRSKKTISDYKKLKDKYEKMLDKVNNWEIPSEEHRELKKFMISQITDSIKWDCSGDYYENNIKTWENYSFDKWYSEMMKSKSDDITYHTTELRKEIEQVEKRNKWIRDLYKSLKNIKE